MVSAFQGLAYPGGHLGAICSVVDGPVDECVCPGAVADGPRTGMHSCMPAGRNPPRSIRQGREYILPGVEGRIAPGGDALATPAGPGTPRYAGGAIDRSRITRRHHARASVQGHGRTRVVRQIEAHGRSRRGRDPMARGGTMGNRGSLTFAREESAASGTRHAKECPDASGHGQVYLPSRASSAARMRKVFAHGGEDNGFGGRVSGSRRWWSSVPLYASAKESGLPAARHWLPAIRGYAGGVTVR